MNCPLFLHLADGSGGLFQVLGVYPPFPVVVGQLARPMECGKIAICVAMHPYFGFDVMAAMTICRNLQAQFLIANTVVVAYRALMLFAQDVAQITSNPWHEG